VPVVLAPRAEANRYVVIGSGIGTKAAKPIATFWPVVLAPRAAYSQTLNYLAVVLAPRAAKLPIATRY
jgi:hypothetical protein